MSTLKRLLEPIKFMKLRYFFYTLGSIYFGVIRPIYALVVSEIIKGIESRDLNYFKTYVIVFFFLVVLNYGLTYFLRTLRRVTIRLFQKKLYDEYLSKYLKADNNKIEGLGTGQSNSILQKGCDNRQRLVTDVFSNGFVRILVSIITIFTMVMMNLGGVTFFVLLAIFVIMMIIAWIGNRHMKNIRDSRREVFIWTDRNIVRLIMSKFEILQNHKIMKELNVISKAFNDLIGWDIKESRGFIVASDLPRALLDFLKVGLLARYGYQIFQGNADIAQFTLIWMLTNQMTSVLFETNDYTLAYFEQISFVQKLRNTFDDMPKLKGYENGKIFKYKRGNIILDSVNFSYGNNSIFDSFCLDIEGGKKTAFVGESGSGKTTLLKMISGYVHPDIGNVIVDGHKLSETMLKSYYQNIGYLTQDPNVFDGTIIDNLLYGTFKKPSKKQIDNAIKSSKCEFIYSFKDGLETQIGEKGVRLSGGQKQRLAIAKLLLKDPKIIFLDEPTSSLDSFSEEDIAKAFDNLFIGRTVVVVAHRLQTVKQADIIHVMQDGNIVESGNHKQLLTKKGIYYKMIELQSGF